MTRRNEIDNDRVFELHQSGLTYSQIAERLGVSRGSISGRIQRHKDYKPTQVGQKRPPAVATQVTRDMIRLYKEGQTIAEIADYYGVSYACVHGRLARKGVLR